MLMAAVLAVGFSASVWAQDAKPADARPADAKPAAAIDDKQFMMDAASSGMKEVMIGQLALRQSENQDVKKFAQRLVDDHTKANMELMTLAGAKNVTLPRMLNEQHQAMVQRISQAKGADFDRTFLTHMVDSHKEGVAKFEAQAQGGKDADVKAFAAKNLPTLKEHLQMAQRLAGQGGAGTGANPANPGNK